MPESANACRVTVSHRVLVARVHCSDSGASGCHAELGSVRMANMAVLHNLDSEAFPRSSSPRIGSCPCCPGGTRSAKARSPASIHHALLFRQLTEDLVYFTRGTDLDYDTRARFAARGVCVIHAPVAAVRARND